MALILRVGSPVLEEGFSWPGKISLELFSSCTVPCLLVDEKGPLETTVISNLCWNDSSGLVLRPILLSLICVLQAFIRVVKVDLHPIEGFGVVLSSQPVDQIFSIRVLLILHCLNKITITHCSSNIFRRAGSFTGDASRILDTQVSTENLFEKNIVDPVVSEIIEV